MAEKPTTDNAFTAPSRAARPSQPMAARCRSCAGATHATSPRRCGRVGHPVRPGDDQPPRRPLRAAGDPPRFGNLRRRPAVSVPRRSVRDAGRRRLRRRIFRLLAPDGFCRGDRDRSGEDHRQRRAVVLAGRRSFATYPLLKAHAAKYGPLALVQFDAHQDTWPDRDGTISHGTFVARAVKEG